MVVRLWKGARLLPLARAPADSPLESGVHQASAERGSVVTAIIVHGPCADSVEFGRYYAETDGARRDSLSMGRAKYAGWSSWRSARRLRAGPDAGRGGCHGDPRSGDCLAAQAVRVGR